VASAPLLLAPPSSNGPAPLLEPLPLVLLLPPLALLLLPPLLLPLMPATIGAEQTP